MTRFTLPKDWFVKQYAYADGSMGYLRIRDEAITKIHHRTAIEALKTHGEREAYGTLLDIGCACGDFTAEVAADFRIPSVIGLDFVRPGLLVARERYPNLAFVEAALPKVPIRDGSVNLVVAMEVLYYLSNIDLKESIQEIHRILAADGIVLVSVNLGTRAYEALSEQQIIASFSEGFVHLGTVYEYCLLQQRLHAWTGRAMRAAMRYRIPFLHTAARLVRGSMLVAKCSYMLGETLLGNRARTKGVFVFRRVATCTSR